jgi:cell division protein FtsI (penicillin-binding protein 3)
MNRELGKWVRLRIIIMGVGLGILFLVVLGRVVKLQLIEGNSLRQLAEREYQKLCPILPIRGSIMDRQGTELAISTLVKSLGAHPSRLGDHRLLSSQLAGSLGMPASQIRDILSKDKPFVWIKRQLTPEQAEAVENFQAENLRKAKAAAKQKTGNAAEAKGAQAMYLIPEARRYYPHQSLAGAILGFCDTAGRGLEGLEKQFDEVIYGKPSKCVNLLDARGHIVVSRENEMSDDIMGDNLVLTLDRTIQYIAEKELNAGVRKWNATGGLVTVVNPQNGEILAMAQTPAFDPNQYYRYTKDQYQNRNVTIALEPGSTFKLFTVAAALDSKVVRSGDQFHCGNGKWQIGNSGIIHDVHPYGSLSVSDIIKKSSNIGAAKIGARVGPTKLESYIRGFGFGARSGICFAGESYGLVRSMKNCRSPIDKVTVCFGQGINTTGLQLTMAMAAFANDGILMQPLLVKEITSHSGKVLKQFNHTPVRQVVSPQTARLMLSIMKTVTETGGTATEAVPSGYTVAGKTGTAQKIVGRSYSKNKYNSLFIGLVPAEHPVLAISVIIDEPKGAIYGGVVAAPIFREIAAQSLRFLGYYPKDGTPPTIDTKLNTKPGTKSNLMAETALPAVEANILPVSMGKKEPLRKMPDFTGMSIRRVLTILNQSKLRCKIEGSGRAFSQHPEPGSEISEGKICYIKFKPHS